jgi:predicted lipoprotein with Yx(FWY)xxD motif
MIGGMRKLVPLIATALLALAGCGGDDEEGAAATPQPTAEPTATAAPAATAAPRSGTRIVVRGSAFGRMLFDSKRQAIYIFERDRGGRSSCYGECARAWPPVFTDGAPVAGKGVRKRLLGSVKRRDGRRQVTYAGKPLYFYAHERPGEVLCHNVDLNGGLWWVVGPDGQRRP